ncbi:MAG: hypothetical protein H7Z21_00670 [Hymenobacter sp.]|nr:hypothetical protein [Hymenobacter sp.]
MELDDFRRGWQQSRSPVGLPTPINSAILATMLARGSRSPVAKMRRNVWLEIGIAAICLVGSVAAAAASSAGYYVWMAGWLALICVLSGFYFRRKLAALRQLSDASGNLREHMTRQLVSLRGLIKLYFRFTMWSVPVSLGIALVGMASLMQQKLAGQKLLLGLGFLTTVTVGLGTLTYFLMRWFTRWWLQRLYGRHLDRLEGLLRELED